MLTWLATLK